MTISQVLPQTSWASVVAARTSDRSCRPKASRLRRRYGKSVNFPSRMTAPPFAGSLPAEQKFVRSEPARALLDHLRNWAIESSKSAAKRVRGRSWWPSPLSRRVETARELITFLWLPILRCGRCRHNGCDANEMVTRNSQSVTRSGALP